MPEALTLNARDLEVELDWFTRVLDTRFKSHFGQESNLPSVFEIAPPDLTDSKSAYASILRRYQMSFSEHLMLLLGLVPHIRPRLLDMFFTKNTLYDRQYTEFGGVYSDSSVGFLPTGETLCFLLAGEDLDSRFQLATLFDPNHYFTKHRIFDFPSGDTQLPVLKAPLQLTQEYISHFTTGVTHRPSFSAGFPAQPITSKMEWEDLVLVPKTLDMVKEIEAWIQHGPTLRNEWEMSGKLRPGYRALFHGPPGTGKTMTASLLGKSTGREVYRIDLSMVVSKYIGETEKNLARVFDKAADKNWILFFDEADALFGKRSSTKEAPGRYANQEVAYLLQRLESFDGIAIIAANFNGNLDNKAFARRFESIIHFPMPGPNERLRIWKNSLPSKAKLAPNVDLQQLAEKYELSGGAISKVIRSASLQALRNGTNTLLLNDLQRGIRREVGKVK